MSANPVAERGWWAGPDAVNKNWLNTESRGSKSACADLDGSKAGRVSRPARAGPPPARRANAEITAR